MRTDTRFRPTYEGSGQVTRRILVLIAGGAIALCCASGCRTRSAYIETAAPIPGGAPAPLTERAPSADEMETPLNGNGGAMLPAVAEAEDIQVPRRKQPPIPPAKKGQSPIVGESITMPTRDLHGYAFPGVEDLVTAEATREQASAKAGEGSADTAEPVPVVEPEMRGDLLVPPPPPGAVSDAQLRMQLEAPPDAMAGAYCIEPGDTLDFQSFNDESLGRELTVRYDGYISLPLIEDIKVAGLTRENCEARMAEAYSDVFRDPQLALIVRETGSKDYTVVGDIETPGRYPYTKETSLIEALSEAGGLRRRNTSSSVGGFVGITGQLTKAFIIRTRNGQRHVLHYDLRSLGTPGAHSSEAPVYYDDVIYVPEGVNLVYVLGESRNPVIIELTEGMTVLQLLALSGGFTASTARLREVVLMRQVDDQNSSVFTLNIRKMLHTGNDVPLNPGDIVYIPRKRLVRLEEFVRRFTGSISPVLNLYNSAVNAYYAKDIAQSILEDPEQNRVLNMLNNIEGFGTSTQNIVELFGRP